MKRCPYCAEEIQDAAVKCRFCGERVDQPPSAARAVAAVAAHGAHHGDPVPIYGGTPSWKARFWSYAGAVALAVAGLAGGATLAAAFDQPPAVSAGIGGALVVAGLVALLVLDLSRRSLRYRISNRTIDVESGFLSRRIETLQLWKVRDIEFEQTLFDRVLNIARIRVFTHDVTTPQFNLVGMPESREVFEKLKEAIELARQSRNVVGVVD